MRDVIMFGYWPLLYPHTLNIKPGENIIKDEDPVNTMTKFTDMLWDKYPDGSTRAAVWVINNDGSPGIILIIDKANDTLEHMKYWSEQFITAWFKLYVAWDDSQRYSIALIPDLNRSINRFKLAAEMVDNKINDDDKIYVIYNFISFYCAKPSQQAQNTFTDKSKQYSVVVYFIDSSDIDKHGNIVEQVQALPSNKHLIVGKFLVPPNQFGHVDSIDSAAAQIMRNLLDQHKEQPQS